MSLRKDDKEGEVTKPVLVRQWKEVVKIFFYPDFKPTMVVDPQSLGDKGLWIQSDGSIQNMKFSMDSD